MKKRGQFLMLLAGMCFSCFALADDQAPAPINPDLSMYSPTVAPVTSITSSSDASSANKTIQQMQQTISALQNQVAIQGHKIAELELRLQVVEMALKQTPAPQTVGADNQKKNSQPVSDSADAQNLYKTAMQQFQDKNYTDAVASLQQYIQEYPNGSSIADAQYWLGEAYAIQGNDSKARQQFLNVTQQYPQSGTAANAMLNLGTIAYSQSDYSAAKDWFTKLVTNYPQTPAAQSANNQLNMLKKAGY